MARARKYATDAERQRAYRERHAVCRAESLLPKRLEDALWSYADGDPEVYEAFVRALLALDPKTQAMLRRHN